MRLLMLMVIFNISIMSVAGEIVTKSISDSWVATDSLGRKLPVGGECPEFKDDKFVAMFYWTWHENCQNEKITNVSDVVAKYSDAVNDYNHKAWKEDTSRHHWNKPLFGYYQSTDKWVLRKHAEMLADAGVDAVVFDCTNGNFAWEDSYHALLDTWTEARGDGINTPKIVFMTAFMPTEGSKEIIENIYNDFYKKGRYKGLWFFWNDKPLVMGYPDNLSDEIKGFFTFRPPQPDYRKGPYGNHSKTQWGWLEVFPQRGYVEYEQGKFEQVTVGVSQNATVSLAPAAMNDAAGAFGRSYTHKDGFLKDKTAYGLNFQEQWDQALKINPKLVFVTGWNEWVAGRFVQWQGTENAFPDQYSNEYSRDIEPMEGGFGDSYYYQLVANIRKFKGIKSIHKVSPPKTIVIDGKFDDWLGVMPRYADHRGDTVHRDAIGYAGIHYTNDTGRNDILSSMVARDEENLYFYAETLDEITTPTDNWMSLLIDVDRDKVSGWEGYDFILNRLKPMQDFCFIEALDSDFNIKKKAQVEYKFMGNKIEISIPIIELGFDLGVGIEFKWIDNVNKHDVMDFYSIGDVAPSGRFNYVYSVK